MLKRKSNWLKAKSFINWLSRCKYLCLFLATIILLIGVRAVAATDVSTDKEKFMAVETIWLMVAGALVFFMNAGFALLEAGFCRTNNAVNVLAKNLIVFCIASLAFYFFGFSLMFGDAASYICPTDPNQTNITNIGLGSWFGWFHHFPTFLEYPRISKNVLNLDFPEIGFSCVHKGWPNRPLAAIFFFQLAFAGTAATIVSGAVAERVRFSAFVVFSFVLVGFLYPLTGHWVWTTYGWLKHSIHFVDFAGSTVVHTVGGTAALTGALILKPRWNRFDYEPQDDLDLEKAQYKPVPDKFKKQTDITEWSNPGFVTLGCLILWLGWLGFNGGSTTDLELVGHVITTTVMAGATGGFVAILFTNFPLLQGSKPRLSSLINGILGGLVGITASSAYVDVLVAVGIGFVCGIFVVLGEFVLEQIKIDDPVGAIPVHLVCGFVGTLAVCFSSKSSSVYSPGENEKGNVLFFFKLNQNNELLQLLAQLFGWLIVFVVIFILSYLVWIIIGWIIHLFDRANSTNKKLPKKGNLWDTIIRTARIGIRVSVEDEEKGSDGFFASNPSGQSELKSQIREVLLIVEEEKAQQKRE